MATYLERYLAGEYAQVWSDLMGLGARVRDESVFADALAVARSYLKACRDSCRRSPPGFTGVTPRPQYVPHEWRAREAQGRRITERDVTSRRGSSGMDERFRRVEQMEQRVQMLLGVFAAHGVLPLEFKPAYSVGDLLLQHLEALEQEAEEKGGVQQVLADHFAKVFKATVPLAAYQCSIGSKRY